MARSLDLAWEEKLRVVAVIAQKHARWRLASKAGGDHLDWRDDNSDPSLALPFRTFSGGRSLLVPSDTLHALIESCALLVAAEAEIACASRWIICSIQL